MTQQQGSTIEKRISDALEHRAQLMPSARNGERHAPPAPAPSRRHSRGLLAAAAVIVVVLGASVVALTLRSDSSSVSKTLVQTSPPSAATSDTEASPAGAEGTELPLATAASSPEIEYLTKQAKDRGAPVAPFAVQATGGAPVVISETPNAATKVPSDCMTIAISPTSAGYQGACVASDDASSQLLATNSAGPSAEVKDGAWYVVWTKVPAGTAYVAFDVHGKPEWQRPVNGVSCFVWTGARLAEGSPLPEAVAYDAQGKEVGRAHFG